MKPEFPIYIPSKGRADSHLTMKVLDRFKLPYHVIVEEAEYTAYAKALGKKRLLVLDPRYQRDYDAMVKLTPEQSRGSGPARNFAWDHAIAAGAPWHWVMDDNIRGWWRMNHNLKVPVGDATIFRCMEDFTLRYRNVAMSGPNYYMFAPRKQPGIKPLTLNTRIYSCNLIRCDLPYRWRGRYNEDTDLSLRLLKAGWCTILFNAFLQWKATATPGVRMKGGNTDEVYQGVSGLEKSKLLVATHPDVAKMVRRWQRWHHQVDYAPFKTNRLIPAEGVKVRRGTDNYGMKLKRVPWDGGPVPFSRQGRVIEDEPVKRSKVSPPTPGGMRYGDALPADFVIPRSMLFWMKKDLSVNPFDRVVVRKGDRVMDCGSCIGTFAAAALEAGAGSVCCYEAMPKNAELLRANMIRYTDRAIVVAKALVADDAETVRLTLSGFSGAHSIAPRDVAGKAIIVPAVCFRKELKAYAPHVLKLDVEGAEYALLESLRAGDLSGVRCVFVEFHPHDERAARLAAFRTFLAAEGFTVVKEKLRAFTAVAA